jgi:hypothetical protein
LLLRKHFKQNLIASQLKKRQLRPRQNVLDSRKRLQELKKKKIVSD